jgi:anti-sigma B factor antagonist
MSRPGWLRSLGRRQPSPLLTIQVTRTARTAAVVCVGEIDTASSTYFTQTLRDAYRRRVDALSLDLTGVEFVDSTGLRCVLEAVREAEAAAVTVDVKQGAHVHRLLELAGVQLPTLR